MQWANQPTGAPEIAAELPAGNDEECIAHPSASVGAITNPRWISAFAHRRLRVTACACPARRIAISRLQQEFQRVVDEHYAALWSYVGMLTGGSPDGEDILHQAFLLAFDRLADGDRSIEHMGKWLRGVVRNLVRAWWREKRKLPENLADRLHDLAEEADSASNVLANAELIRALEHCLGQLAPAARRFVAARYEKGPPIHEIAEQEDLNDATARVRLFRIRQTLKSCLEAALAEGAIQ